MSFTKTRGLAWLTAAATFASLAIPANAQFWPSANPCSSCAQSASIAPMYQTASVANYQTASAAQQPGTVCVPQTQYICYRPEPKTTYKEVKQVVRKPEYKTVMQDQQYTTYQTQYEQRTAQIPQVSYQPVTEYQNRTVDMGQWQTYTECRPKISSCQYDNRPSFLGWMNRNMYSVRSAFTPDYVTRRQYVPNVVAQQIPTTRMVAIPSTKEVSYTVAKQVPITETRQVAIQVMEWKEEVQVAQVPVTTYEMKPYGTQTAYGFVPWNNASGTATAAQPDPNFLQKAETPNTNKTSQKPADTRSGYIQQPAPVMPASAPSAVPRAPQAPVRGGYYTLNNNQLPAPQQTQVAKVATETQAPSNPLPTIVQASGWKARTLKGSDSLNNNAIAQTPQLTPATVQLADSK